MLRVSSILILGGFLSAPVAADDVVRVTDLIPGAGSGVTGMEAGVFGGRLYFRGRDDASSDLWSYDGVASPTVVAGTEGASPEQFAAWNGGLYFRAQTGFDVELWRLDEDAVGEVLDLDPAASSGPEGLTPFGDRLCFRASLPVVGNELVCWDGTGSSFDSWDLRPGADSSSPQSFAVVGDRLYFEAFDAAAGGEPWSFDGLSDPALVEDLRSGLASSLPHDFTAVAGDSDLYFAASPLPDGLDRLFRFDGVHPPESPWPDFVVTGALAGFRGRLYVVGYDQQLESAATLWRLEGATLVEIGGPVELSLVGEMVPFANSLYFVSGSTTAAEIFRFSGVAPPIAVTDFPGATAYVATRHLVMFDGRLFFVARDAAAGSELWALTSDHLQSDGFEHGDLLAWSVVHP